MRTILSSSRASQRLRELMVKQGMEKAVYDTRAAPHFALDEAIYAHTTSPIRRYADLRCQQRRTRCTGADHRCRRLEGAS